MAGRLIPRTTPLATLIAAVGLALAAAPTAAAAQQKGAVRDTADAALRADSAAAAGAVQPDTLSLRERALQRLRALPETPIQLPPEDSTTAADADTSSAVIVTPGEPADTVGGARLEARAEQERPEAERAEQEGALGEDLDEDRPTPTDTILSDARIRELLRALPGYEITEYRGEAAVYTAESSRLRLTGQSRVARTGSSLETDSVLVYAGDTGIVCGYGNPILSGETDPVESDRVCFSMERELGMAVGARTKFVQGATWYVRGAENRVYLLTGGEEQELYGEHAEFTSCDLPEPHYTFEAGSLKMVEGDVMVARDVTLQFEDVPVFWLPWMVQSMKRGRRSGLLMPEFGVNDIVRNSTGYERHISNLGFYWAINDYISARGTFEWYSNNWTAVQGGLSYYWRRQFLRGQWSVKQYWREGLTPGDPGRRDMTISTSNSWQPDERTRIQLSGDYATSTDFVRDNSFDPRELNRRISASGSVDRDFDWGSMSVGAQRQQQISTGREDLTLPSLNLSLRPITLFSNDDGTLNMTWTGSGTAERSQVEVQEHLYETVRDEEELTASGSHSLSFGRLSFSQSFNYLDEVLGPRPPLTVAGPDSVPTEAGQYLLEDATETLSWNTSVGYQQNLWTGTTLTPRITISGNQVRDDSTGGAFLAAPNRISAGAGLSTTIFGFWPGIAGFSRIRHKISPSLSWSYSPQPDVTAAQERVFGIDNLREQNRLTLSFNQTFEAKLESDEDAALDSADTVLAEPEPAGEAGEATEAGDADETAERGEPAEPGEPRRLPQVDKVMLLSINTSGPFVYDFISAREGGRGFLTDRVGNSIRSDLLRGLSINLSHDLFDEGEVPADGGLAPRSFDPFLTNVNASFSIDDDFWLFRLLGLSADPVPDAADPDEISQDEREAEGVANSEDARIGAEMDPERVQGAGSIVPGRGPEEDGVRRGIGGWQAALNYSLSRFRPAEDGAEREAEQTVSGNLSFEPTEHWSVRWSTSYSFTAGEFNQHVLTLSRDLHRWQANFDFIKAQNGNFVMQFRVQLIDNPDLKLDYDQRTDPSDRRRTASQ